MVSRIEFILNSRKIFKIVFRGWNPALKVAVFEQFFVADDDENLEEIRRKLIKNRERLFKLLNHGPDLIVQKSKSVENQAAAVESG